MESCRPPRPSYVVKSSAPAAWINYVLAQVAYGRGELSWMGEQLDGTGDLMVFHLPIEDQDRKQYLEFADAEAVWVVSKVEGVSLV